MAAQLEGDVLRDEVDGHQVVAPLPRDDDVRIPGGAGRGGGDQDRCFKKILGNSSCSHSSACVAQAQLAMPGHNDGQCSVLTRPADDLVPSLPPSFSVISLPAA
jgi:hypothetical protein